ncbi:5965_t:CDS:2, partial [Racocetra fulgida]
NPIFIGIEIIGERDVCNKEEFFNMVKFEFCDIEEFAVSIFEVLELKKIFSDRDWGVDYSSSDSVYLEEVHSLIKGQIVELGEELESKNN